MNNKYYIYHHIDADGKGSATVVILYLLSNHLINSWNDDRLELIPFNYEKSDTFVPIRDYKENDEVFIVDLSVSDGTIGKFLDYLDLLHSVNVNLHWIDHHTSSNDCLYNVKNHLALKHNIKDGFNDIHSKFNIVINTEYCGMYNCWRTFFKDNPVPEIIRLIDDWDCWKHKLSSTKPFHYGFELSDRCEPVNEDWQNYLTDRGNCLKIINDSVNSGKAILDYLGSTDKNNYKYHFDCKFVGFNCCCLNIVRNSDIFLDNINDYDIVLSFIYDGKGYKYSIYCKKGSVAKCNLIAEMFGGGGHTCAAGFYSKKLVVKNNNSVLYKIKEIYRKHKYKKCCKKEG